MAAQHLGARPVRVAARREDQLERSFPRAVVEVLVVEVEPLDREARILEHVAAAAALLERELARLMVEEIAGAQVHRELLRAAERTVLAARLVEATEPAGDRGLVARLLSGGDLCG